MSKFFHISSLAYILLAFLLASCGSDRTDEPGSNVPGEPQGPNEPQEVEHPVGFSPAETPISRAASPLEDNYNLFKVWTYKNTSSSQAQNVMPGYQVKYIDNTFRWQYDGLSFSSHTELTDQLLKYWDASSLSYEFYAIAPAQVPDGLNLTFTPGGSFNITGIPTHTENTVDLVIAKQERHISDAVGLKDIDALIGEENEVQPSVFYDPVPLRFHHLLSKVEYRIYNTGSKTADVSSVIVNFENGESIYTSGEITGGSWSSLGSPSNTLMSMIYIEPNLLQLPSITQDNYKTHSHSIITYYEIPQNLYQDINVTVEVDGQVVSKTFEIGNAAWQYDTYYVYYIHIAAGEGDNSPILIDLTVDDFLEGDPIDQEQTNW